jgi:hypothetical protein
MTIDLVPNDTNASTDAPAKKTRKARGPRRTPAVLFEKPVGRATKTLELVLSHLGRMKGADGLKTAHDHLSAGLQYVASAMDELKAIPSEAKLSTARRPDAKVGGRPRSTGVELVGKTVAIKARYLELYTDVFTPDEAKELQVAGARANHFTVVSGGNTLFIPRNHVEVPKQESPEAPAAS